MKLSILVILAILVVYTVADGPACFKEIHGKHGAPTCPENYSDHGKWCHRHVCPSSVPKDYKVICCASTMDCLKYMAKIGVSALGAIASIMEAATSEGGANDAIQNTLQNVLGLKLPKCETFS